MSYLVVALTILTLGSFTWALRRHFRAPDGTPAGMKALTLVSSLAAVLFIVLVLRNGVGTPGAVAFVVSSVLSMALFWWAIDTTRRRPPHLAHSDRDPDMLYEDGPYAFVRHPFYLAYCLFWFGSAIAGGGLQWLVAAVLITWYYAAARTEEAHFLRSPLAASYTNYRTRTGMIVPKIREMRRR